MDRVSNSLKINDCVSISQLKKRFKLYMNDCGYGDFKQSIFPQSLVLVLVQVMEEILSDSFKFVVKHDVNGLYIINKNTLDTTINESTKYDFTLKYLKKYDSKIKYDDSLFFNIKKVCDNLESKYGDKLMINFDARNTLSYILLSIQYELSALAFRIIRYSNKRTLNKNVLIVTLATIFSDDICNKIKIKLDSAIEVVNDETETATEIEVEVEEDDEEDLEK
jgi:hypothetical protein